MDSRHGGALSRRATAPHPGEGEGGQVDGADVGAAPPELQGPVVDEVDGGHGGGAIVPRDGLHQWLVPAW